MLLFKIPFSVEYLVQYPGKNWGEKPTHYWMELCNQLQEYNPTSEATLSSVDPHRKWEMVSAYQKCVRRGLTKRAQWLVTGFLLFPRKERSYFWRRICTTAAEDVGYGDVELMNFVMACSQFFSASTESFLLKRVWLFLTQKMCATQRSRIFCQLSRGAFPDKLNEWEAKVVAELERTPPSSLKTGWVLKNNWRGEGMLKFQLYVFDFALSTRSETRKFEIIGGLPDFCYDQHTRTGKKVCYSLCENPLLKNFLTLHPSKEKKDKVVGLGLFFAEGGFIQNGWFDRRLDLLEARGTAQNYGWEGEIWLQWVELIARLVADGSVNTLRKNVCAEEKYE